MYIKKDYSYIGIDEKKLIENSFGELSVHSIHFDRYFTEEQKQKNREQAQSLSKDQWNNVCDNFVKSLSKPLNEIIEKLDKKYNIHQTRKETSTTAHYKSDWDLFFYSDKGWNGKDFMTYFSLSFNDKRTPKQNMELLKEIIALIETMEYENIYCRVQYDAIIDKKKVEEKSKSICNSLIGKSYVYHGMVGKIKLVKRYNGIEEYGFFKKHAKSLYYSISHNYIVASSL